ncbi:MAG TPA: hypothetical protein VGA49_01610 [Patescibacteria group bacterium]
MKQFSLLILRIGLAITFIWIGVLIFRQPEAWGGYLQPWAANLLPIPIKEAMLGVAVLDIFIGILILSRPVAWLAALIGSFHLLTVLIGSGINDVTVRDIGLLAGMLAIVADHFADSSKKDIMT